MTQLKNINKDDWLKAENMKNIITIVQRKGG